MGLGIGFDLSLGARQFGGGAGSDSVMSFSSTSPSRIWTPNQAAFAPADGGFELDLIDVQPDNFAAGRSPASVLLSAGDQRSWYLVLQVSGLLTLTTYTTGTDASVKNSTAIPWAANSDRLSLRIRYDADNGSTQNETTFSYSTDLGGTWTPVNTVTQAGVKPVFASTAPFELGGFNTGTGQPFAGTMKRAIYKTLAAAPIVDADPSAVVAAELADDAWTSPTTGEDWASTGNASVVTA